MTVNRYEQWKIICDCRWFGLFCEMKVVAHSVSMFNGIILITDCVMLTYISHVSCFLLFHKLEVNSNITACLPRSFSLHLIYFKRCQILSNVNSELYNTLFETRMDFVFEMEFLSFFLSSLFCLWAFVFACVFEILFF